jgi:hypothetical protein
MSSPLGLASCNCTALHTSIDRARLLRQMYTQFAKSLGINPNTTQTIPFSCVNASYLYSLEDIVLKDNEDVCRCHSRTQLDTTIRGAQTLTHSTYVVLFRWACRSGGSTGSKVVPRVAALALHKTLQSGSTSCVPPITFDATRMCVR